MRRHWMNRGLFALICALLLSACGGGGGGSATSTANTVSTGSTPAHGTATYALTAGNLTQTAAWSHVATRTLARAIRGLVYMMDPLDIKTPVTGFACGGGGSTQARYVDTDANGVLSVSDQFVFVFSNCPGFWLRNGTATMVITGATGSELYTANLTLNGLAYGDLAIPYGVTPALSGTVSVELSAVNGFVLRSPGSFALSIAPAGRVVNLTNINVAYITSSLTGSLDIEPAFGTDSGKRFNLDISGRLDDALIYANSPPAPGQLQVKAANGTAMRLGGSGFTFNLSADLNGDGTYEQTPSVSDTALFGAL